jgi:hypothetical protein
MRADELMMPGRYGWCSCKITLGFHGACRSADAYANAVRKMVMLMGKKGVEREDELYARFRRREVMGTCVCA